MHGAPILCPSCAAVHRSPASTCEHCLLALDWLDHYPGMLEILNHHGESRDERESPPQAIPRLTGVTETIALQAQIPTAIQLDEASAKAMTSSSPRGESNNLWVIPWHDASRPRSTVPRLFVVVCGGPQRVLINRHPVRAAELHAGDVLQIEGYGWTFSGLDLHLIPLAPMVGVGLLVEQVHIKNRLGPQLSVRIDPGQFVAVVGESGAGKSTLLKVLAGFQGNMESGTVSVVERDGKTWSRSQDSERFRRSLGYVSQEAILHVDLSAQQTLRLSASLRGKTVDLATVEWTLLRAEMDRDRWQNPVRSLSGGENKRLRTANELMGEPRLLLLDEPDSGLDERRRLALMRFLRTLSWQGCTVVMVTHHTSHVQEYCDRILEIDQQRISRDRLITVAPHLESGAVPVLHRGSPQARRAPWRQLFSLIQRELWLIAGSPLRRVLLPTGVAMLFAVAISVATTPAGTAMLGFLAIISVLWMSSSLSLLGIVGERPVFDHERHLFLSVPSYLFAKFLVHAAMSVCQTLIFLSAIGMARSALHRSHLHDFVQTCLTLCLVGLAGVALGLLISALARTSKEAATTLLPLVMVAQIVFSVPIATDDATNDTVIYAYQKLDINEVKYGAALASYATISRPADIALRTFSYFGDEQFNARSDSPKTSGLAELVIWTIGLLIVSFFILAVQAKICSE